MKNRAKDTCQFYSLFIHQSYFDFKTLTIKRIFSKQLNKMQCEIKIVISRVYDIWYACNPKNSRIYI